METTLIFSIESGLAQMANSYAEKKGCTLSNLVENYFIALVKSEESNEATLTAPIASALFGSLKAPDKADYKKELENSLTEKYI